MQEVGGVSVVFGELHIRVKSGGRDVWKEGDRVATQAMHVIMQAYVSYEWRSLSFNSQFVFGTCLEHTADCSHRAVLYSRSCRVGRAALAVRVGRARWPLRRLRSAQTVYDLSRERERRSSLLLA